MSTGPQETGLVWLTERPHTPPWSKAARQEVGLLLRHLQRGTNLGLPHSRPMPSIAPRCHELRVRDEEHNWRLIYRVDEGSVVVIHIFAKTTRATPRSMIELCQKRLKAYDKALREMEGNS